MAGVGRPKGVPLKNKRGLLARLQREFPNYHPVIEMARMANDPDATRDQKFAANKEVSKYVTPQLKAIEHTGDASSPLHHIVSANPMSLDEWEASQKEPE